MRYRLLFLVALSNCSLLVLPFRCGDGLQSGGEACDEGERNANTPNTCRTTCQLPSCGDGVVDDQTETVDLDGDGLFDAVEQCEQVSAGVFFCDDLCQEILINCGDGVQQRGEACDDGNTLSGDGCRNDCLKSEACGDGVLDSGEQCDNGDPAQGGFNSDVVSDACRTSCENPRCGDNVVDTGEQCEPPGSVNCSSLCFFLNNDCGNLILEPGETCDDGNVLNGDGCRSNCTLEVCDDGIADPNLFCFGPVTLAGLGLEDPQGIAAGDLDELGKDDIATANFEPNNSNGLIGLFFNTDAALGVFDSPQTRNSNGPNAIAISNLNPGQDSFLDLIVTTNVQAFGGPTFGTTIAVFLGQDGRTFGNRTTFAVGSRPTALVAADLDGDSLPDIAVTNNNSDNLSVLLGNGDGTLQAQQTFATGNGPKGITAALLNDDSFLDLVVTNRVGDNNVPDQVSVLLGNGDGTFQARQSFTVGENPVAVIALPLDGDAFLDLVVANDDDNNLSILLGDGDGTFQPQSKITTGNQPSALVVGDFNSDGLQDFAVALFLDDEVAFFLNNGTNQPTALPPLLAGDGPTALTVGNFNQDASVDVAVANNLSGEIGVFLSVP